MIVLHEVVPTRNYQNQVERVLVELDEQLASVWQTIIENGEGEWLAQRIEEFDLQPENVNMVLTTNYLSIKEKAFQTVLQNRVSHGGILAKGAGLIKNGENGKGP